MIAGALVAEPHDPGLLGRMAEIAYRRNQVDEALRMAGLAIAADPDRVDAHLTAALAFEASARVDEAVRHARIAISLEPDNARALLVFAGVLSRGFGPSDGERGEARTAVVRALRLEPGAETHAAAADLELEFGDRIAAAKHVADGLALNSLHPDLMMLQARLDVWRGSPLGVVRGLLASRPGQLPARQLLAATTWRSLLRLAGWVWACAGIVALASIWASPGTLSWLTPALCAIIPVAWLVVLRTLSRQLPEGYLVRRVRGRPEAVAGLATLALAGSIAVLATLLLRMGSSVDSARTGYLLLVIAAAGAGLGHGLLFCSWMRRNGGEENSLGSFAYAAKRFAIVAALALIAVGAVAGLSDWSNEPAAWTLAAVACLAVGTLAVEMPLALAVVARRRRQRRMGAMLVALCTPLIVLAGAGFAWSAAHIGSADYNDTERSPKPTIQRPTTVAPTTTTVKVTPTPSPEPPPAEVPPPPEEPAPPAEGIAPPPEGVAPPPEPLPPPPVEELPPPPPPE